MYKRLLTIEQLVAFCEENKFLNFSAEETGYSLAVQIPGTLAFAEDEESTLLFARVKVCHTDRNANNSFISEENMKKAMPSLKYQPILASFVEVDGEKDFNSHDIEVIEEDGEKTFRYIEQQVGSLTADEPVLEYDEEADKTYVIANAVIPRIYTDAANIIERKGGTKVSCELIVKNMSYNAQEKYLDLQDFEFSGVTLLGEHVEEGMKGSRLDIADFSQENNSVQFSTDEDLSEMIADFTKSDDHIEDDPSENSKKGGTEVNKLEELLAQYSKTVEDLTFEYADLTDEELIAAFEEAFSEGEPESDPEPIVDNNTLNYSVTLGETTRAFSVSLNDKLSALFDLVNSTYSEADGDSYFVEVFDDPQVVNMHGWYKNYRQAYSVQDDSYTLEGDRVEIFNKWMTKEESDAFEKMTKDFEEVSAQLKEYQDAEAEANKVEILNSDEYAPVASDAEFEALVEDHANFSVEEVQSKADAILLAYAKQGKVQVNSKQFVDANTATKKVKSSRYGNLFNK